MNPDRQTDLLDGFLSIRAAIRHDKALGVRESSRIRVALKYKRQARRAIQLRRNMASLEASES